MNIVVLAGGLSTERDVSLVSGAGITKTLIENGHNATLLDVYLGLPNPPQDLSKTFKMPHLDITKGIGSDEPDLEKIKASREIDTGFFLGPNVIELCRMADIVFIALHGDVGENGKIQATFDLLGIRYTGPSSLGSALAMDKGVSKDLFTAAGIPNAKGVTLSFNNEDTSLSQLGLSYPVVIKPCSGGSSVGVFIVNNDDEYKKALKASFKYENEVIIEEYIKGREFAVGLLDGKALPVIEIVPNSGFFDYKNKYQSGLTKEICPAPISEDLKEKMQSAAEKAYKKLQLDIYSRADFLLKEDGSIYCLEVNSLPGMTPQSLLPKEALAAGISYSKLCETIINLSLKRFKEDIK